MVRCIENFPLWSVVLYAFRFFEIEVSLLWKSHVCGSQSVSEFTASGGCRVIDLYQTLMCGPAERPSVSRSRCATQQLAELTASPSGYEASISVSNLPDRP
jgi:hypothetical protein